MGAWEVANWARELRHPDDEKSQSVTKSADLRPHLDIDELKAREHFALSFFIVDVLEVVPLRTHGSHTLTRNAILTGLANGHLQKTEKIK